MNEAETLSASKETKMIKPLNSPQLSAVKPRCGLQSISDLLPRLIRQYELQAELMRRSELAASSPAPTAARTSISSTVLAQSKVPAAQATFGWYE